MSISDIKLIIYIFLISVIMYLSFEIINSNTGGYAYVYYDNNEIKKIDLKIDDEYTVEGYNGKIKLEVKDNKIRVKEETSKYHLCSYQGYIGSSNEVIVCLPNKVVIKIKDEEELDSIVR